MRCDTGWRKWVWSEMYYYPSVSSRAATLRGACGADFSLQPASAGSCLRLVAMRGRLAACGRLSIGLSQLSPPPQGGRLTIYPKLLALALVPGILGAQQPIDLAPVTEQHV